MSKKTSVFIFIILIFSIRDLAKCQNWSLPEIIYEDTNQIVKALSIKVDSIGAFHIVWGAKTSNITKSDSIYYLKKNKLEFISPTSISCDTTVKYINSAFDLDGNLNVIWGEGKKDFPPEIENIYHSKIVKMKWTDRFLIDSYQNKYDTPRKLAILSLPDSSLLAYWNINGLPEMRFAYFNKDHWTESFKPFPKYSWDPKLGYSGYCFYPNLYIENNTIYLTFRGIADGDLPPHGFKSQILYVENDPRNRNWELLEPQKVTVSTSEFYHYPKILCTKSGIRYLVWETDKNLDNFPDNIYYMFSFDGLYWQGPQEVTNFTNGYIQEHQLSSDQYGNVFVFWKARSTSPNGDLITKHHYAIVNEDSYSCFDDIPYYYFKNNAGLFHFIVDSQSYLHLFWLENKNKTNIGFMIKHIWKRITTSVSSKERTQAIKSCYEKIMARTYPNPFNKMASLEINLSEPLTISVAIYNINGQIVKTLLINKAIKSKVQILWNGIDDNGKAASSGVYYFLITAQKNGIQYRKFVKFIMLR